MIRVAIVDDHPIARRGIEQVLSAVDGVGVVASVASAGELVTSLVEGPPPDLVVLDLYLDGDEPSLRAVAELSACTRVLVMSASGRPADVLGAIRAGASGYLTKHADPMMIVAAVETVAGGGFSLSSELADIIQAELITPGSVRPHGLRATQLSPREEQVLGFIAQGLTHGQTATRMGIRKATVDTYVERIRSKLQVGNKAELTRAAMERLGLGATTRSPMR